MQYEIDIESPHKKLFLEARELLLAIEGVQETKKEKITTYSYNGSGLCHMRTMPHGVDLGFLKGIQLGNKYGLLHGDSKRMRTLSMEKMKKKELKPPLKCATTPQFSVNYPTKKNNYRFIKIALIQVS